MIKNKKFLQTAGTTLGLVLLNILISACTSYCRADFQLGVPNDWVNKDLKVKIRVIDKPDSEWVTILDRTDVNAAVMRVHVQADDKSILSTLWNKVENKNWAWVEFDVRDKTGMTLFGTNQSFSNWPAITDSKATIADVLNATLINVLKVSELPSYQVNIGYPR